LSWRRSTGSPDASVDVRFADLPQIEGMLKQMALVAELEAGFISDRTKAALAAAKRRGKELGGFRAGAKATAKARQKGADANAEAAAARAADLAPVITGATSLRAIASSLNDRGIPTAGGRKWFAASSATCSPGSECCDRAPGAWTVVLGGDDFGLDRVRSTPAGAPG
jgi:hypothetical protein